MKCLFLFTFLITNFIGLSQINYLEYHQQCRLAEKQFLDNDTAGCFKTYNQVFNSFDILFPRDCFMAAQFAHKFRQDSLAVEFIIKAIPFGLNPEFFLDTTERKLNLFNLKNSLNWNKLTSQYDSLRNIYIQSVDWDLKKQIIKKVRIDQDWRRRNNTWFVQIFRRGLERKFDKVNKQHVSFLDSIFKTKGYPGSWLTGIGDSLPSEVKYAISNNSNLSDLPWIILVHYDSSYQKYGAFLMEELKKGHISPRNYAMLRDFNDRYLVKKSKNEKMHYNIWWERENYTKEEYEAHRNEIGCISKAKLRLLSRALGKDYDSFWSPFR